jgi:hypothetical protein
MYKGAKSGIIFCPPGLANYHKEFYMKELFYTILVFSGTLCMVYGKDDNVWDYYEENGYVVITNYRGNDTEIIIPSYIAELPVLKIQNYQYKGPYAVMKVVFFGNGRLAGVTIPHCVTSIDSNTFVGNLLTSVDIGANVALGIDAIPNGFVNFYNNSGKREGKYTYNINGTWTYKQPTGTRKQ